MMAPDPPVSARRLQRLDPDPVRHTVERLQARITERFPQRNLRNVAAALTELVQELATRRATTRARLRTWRTVSRVAMAVIAGATLVAVVLIARNSFGHDGVQRSFDWLPLIESTINDLVFAGLAVFFLYALPNRIARGHTLKLLHRLRSLAHIIDMHQLTKDPERLSSRFVRTRESVDLRMTVAELEVYLEYCSELLSLVAKAAALCAEESQDAVVLDTVSTIETMTLGMSRKIWQKISLLPKAAPWPDQAA